ncbi:hypothetical protein AVEN_166568-1 [Araneus ventricosus]|uniref:Uncharacterized protein n=1 Tax=Araneus ventricosus TaxID=182803 RepID=A0A4Y2L2U4_ARAVE|nr:hypothetical protein AVEN_166568-1 [Araneus ventricosus]
MSNDKATGKHYWINCCSQTLSSECHDKNALNRAPRSAATLLLAAHRKEETESVESISILGMGLTGNQPSGSSGGMLRDETDATKTTASFFPPAVGRSTTLNRTLPRENAHV